MSLKDIMRKKVCDRTSPDKVETYIQLSDMVDDFEEDGYCERD